jgi:hypothetical protein
MKMDIRPTREKIPEVKLSIIVSVEPDINCIPLKLM